MSGSTMMTQEPVLAGRVLPADRFHPGVRLAALAIWFGAIALIYFTGNLLFSLAGGALTGASFLVLTLGAMLLAQPVARWGERLLIARWPSGRAVQLGAGALTLHEKSGAVRIDLRQKVNYWRWRFVIRRTRGGRVPNGHACMAARLAQNEAAVSVYAFLSPKQTEALAARYPFYELRAPSDKDRPLLGGRDAMYLAAEKARWESGAEVDPADFETLLDYLAGSVPEFRGNTAS